MALDLVGCGDYRDDTGIKVYNIGTDVTYPPFEMEIDGKLAGVDMEILTAMLKIKDLMLL